MMAAAFVSSCIKDEYPEVYDTPEGMVPLELKLGGVYSPVMTTKAAENPGLKDDMIHEMEEGWTLRLIILEREPSGNVVEKDNVVGEFVYVIQNDKWGKSYPLACEVDENGVLTPGSVTTEPYYLPAAEGSQNITYYCMAISPAKALHEVSEDGKTIMKVQVKNHENFLASNNKWQQTMYNTFEVSSDVTQKATANLKPLMPTTAKINVRIVNGDHVTELTPSEPVLELDRIPTDPGEEWIGDKLDNTTHMMPLYNLPVGDEIEKQHGNNILYNRIYIYDSLYDDDFANTGTEDNPIWTKSIEITSEANILPMDARPTPMIIRINMKVNLTPMQFQFQTNEVFEPGHVYNYTAKISMQEGNIYIASWQDVSWNWPLTPNANQ